MQFQRQLSAMQKRKSNLRKTSGVTNWKKLLSNSFKKK